MAESETQILDEGGERRSFLTRLASLGLLGGLVAAYGTFAGLITRFMYPARAARRGWMYVRSIEEVSLGESFVYRLPSGAPVNITRRKASGAVSDFIALSSTCPHLGCQVHWEGQNNRFFCPCHNGIFDPQGVAIGGPPADAGQSLPDSPCLSFPSKLNRDCFTSKCRSISSL